MPTSALQKTPSLVRSHEYIQVNFYLASFHTIIHSKKLFKLDFLVNSAKFLKTPLFTEYLWTTAYFILFKNRSKLAKFFHDEGPYRIIKQNVDVEACAKKTHPPCGFNNQWKYIGKASTMILVGKILDPRNKFWTQTKKNWLRQNILDLRKKFDPLKKLTLATFLIQAKKFNHANKCSQK